MVYLFMMENNLENHLLMRFGSVLAFQVILFDLCMNICESGFLFRLLPRATGRDLGRRPPNARHKEGLWPGKERATATRERREKG